MTSNMKLKVSAFELPPYVTPCIFRGNWTASDESRCNPGYAIDLLRLITGDVPWELTQHFTTGEAGSKNGTLVNSIANSFTQLSPPMMFYSDERNNVVKYVLQGIAGSKLGYLVHHDESHVSWPIFAPFTRAAWILGATAYIVTAAALSFARYRYQHEFKMHTVIYDMSFGQMDNSAWKSRAEKIIITVWSALSKVIASLYCFYFVLAIVPPSPANVAQRFSSVHKVAAKLEEGYMLVIKDNSQFYLDFMNNPEKKINELFRRNYRLSSINDNHHSLKTLVNYTVHHKKTIMPFGDVSIAIYYRNLFHKQQEKTRNVIAVSDIWDASPRFLIASKELPNNMSLRFQQRIGRIHESGLAERLARVYKMDDVTKQQELSFNHHPNPLKDAIDMRIVMKLAVIWLFGIAIALMSFATEFIVTIAY